MDGSTTYEELLARDGRFVYNTRGVSMRPLLRERRDLVRIERLPPEGPKKFDAVLFRRDPPAGAYVLHRVLRVNGDGTYWIVGDNCASGETVRREQILGVMTAVVRDGKTVTPGDFWYRAYVRLWCGAYPARFALLRLRGIAAGLWRRIHP